MAVTNTLQRIVTVAQTYIRNAPLTFPTFPAPNDLVFLAGDWVRQFILSPPFSWRWNRKRVTFTTTAGVQDYIISVPDYGWAESSTLVDNSQAPANTVQLQIKLSLSEESVTNQPLSIAADSDDNAGNITFRLFPIPDRTYSVNVAYQGAPPNFANLSDLWTPIPDYLSYLYTQGFMAKAYEYFADDRFGAAVQLFIKQTIAANGGLDATQVNLFLGEQIDSARQRNNELQMAQLSNQGRYLG